MRYNPGRDSYTGDWLEVPGSLLNQVLTLRVRGGQQADAALEDLLDELTWSPDVPGVTLLRPAPSLDGDASLAALPWALRPRVAVMAPDESTADVLQAALEQHGFRAPAYVLSSTDRLAALRAFLAPTPAVCLIAPGGGHHLVRSRLLRRSLPSVRFVELVEERADVLGGTPEREAAAQQLAETDPERLCLIALAAVQQALASPDGSVPSESPRHVPEQVDESAQQRSALLCASMAMIMSRSESLVASARQQQVESLAFRGWARSLRRRDRAARARSAMLREQTAALRASAPALWIASSP